MVSLNQRIPSYLKAIAPYQPGKTFADIARAYGFQEDQVVKLASNENPLGMSPKGREAMLKAAADLGRYPDGNGFNLKQALAKRFGLSTQTITLGNGSNDILELVAHAFLAPGKESLMSDHSFAVYALASQAVGATLVSVPAQSQDLGHDLDGFSRRISGNTAVVWIANPNNPTGSFIPAAELEAFIAGLPATVLVVLDEAYTEYLSEQDSYPAFEWVKRYPNLLVSRSFSKAYGLAGLRVGYGVASEEVTDLLNRVRQPFNVNSLALAAAEASIFDDDFLARSAELNRQGMLQIQTGLQALGVGWFASWGNFLLVDLQAVNPLEPKPGAVVYEALLSKGVITRPVANYGLPG
ncbi:MAG: histidinol-phosphate transaminase, partial [Burkholderiaceae bacterium]